MDDPKAVLAQLPSPSIKHGAKLKEIRAQWDNGCSKILQKAHLTREHRIKVAMDWLGKANVRDFVLGELILSFSRPLPPTPTDEQRKERRQKTFVRMAYHDDLPHLRAVNKVVTDRLEGVIGDAAESLAFIDLRDEREKASPGTMFAEFAKSIEEQVVLGYKVTDDQTPFADAAE
jgi:hypothetical protein